MESSALDAIIGGVLAIGGGVIGGIVTGWYTLRSNQQTLDHAAEREERERKLSFRHEQLESFYGPAVACMEELEECWYLLFEAEKSVQSFLARRRDEEGATEELEAKQRAVVSYKQYLYDHEVAVFNKVKDLFIDHFGLAEESTKQQYRVIVRFIENRNIIRVTDKQLDLSFTGEGASGIRDKLAALFDNLADLSTQIRSQIESGDPRPLIPAAEAGANATVKRPEAAGAQAKAATPPKTPAPVPAPAEAQDRPSKKQWAGRYTLLEIHQEVDQASGLPAAAPESVRPPATGEGQKRVWPGRYTLLTDSGKLQKLSEEIARARQSEGQGETPAGPAAPSK